VIFCWRFFGGVRATEQNKIPVLLDNIVNTYIKQVKKTPSNFIDKKCERKKPYFFGLCLKTHLI
jgi:hypothetical protein